MNYKKINQENIKDIGIGYIYEHIKTGAKIVYISNEDKNRVFSIAFRTLPKNDTGVFHVLEHCVLCGSLKYPLKEPFNQLDKCTINTYLNAITFADKTLYPIASINEKDYFKLMDVYLDAVFFPLIKDKKGIFLQEGWNFDGEDINGVVYNEMKGAYSTPDALIDFKVKQKLFSNEGYAFESGGYPDDITNLSYEEFINTYEEYYTPSNSIIYFYGDLDIDYYLDYLDREYLSKFEKSKPKIIEKSKNLEKPILFEDTYYIDDEDLENKNYIQASFKLNFSKNEEKNLLFDIASEILTENQNGILKKALVEAGVCEDVSSYIDDDMLEPVFSIIIEETREDNLDRFKDILENTIKNLDIDISLLEGGIVSTDFYFKEKDFGYKPKGLFYNICLLRNMLYEKYDFDNIKFDNLINNLNKLDLKQLLLENLVYNNNAVFGILKPTNTINKDIKDFNFEKNTKELLEYQQEIDSKENIAKIPPLEIKDISRENFKIDTKIEDIENMPFIYNIIDSQIVYFNLKIDTSSLAKEYAEYINIYIYLAGKLSTKKYSALELEKQINLIIGSGSSVNGVIFLEEDNFTTGLSLSARFFNENLEKGFELLNEIFKNTNFDDRENIKKLLLEMLYKTKLNIIRNSKDYAIKRAKSYISSRGVYSEKIEGIDFYFWLKDLCENIDENTDDIIYKMKYINKNIFDKSNAFIGTSCNQKMLQKVKDNIFRLEFLQDIKREKIKLDFKIKNQNEAFALPIDVNYNVMVCKIEDFEYLGDVEILKRILQSQYIWEKIRTEGGAYGGDIILDDNGYLTLLSYMDPNIERTYNIFTDIPEYIKQLEFSEDDIHMYKIGTINLLDRPFKDNEINKVAMHRYFRGLSEEILNRQRGEILDAKVDDIKKYGKILESGIKNSKICTFGVKSDINTAKNIFKDIKTID